MLCFLFLISIVGYIVYNAFILEYYVILNGFSETQAYHYITDVCTYLYLQNGYILQPPREYDDHWSPDIHLIKVSERRLTSYLNLLV